MEFKLEFEPRAWQEYVLLTMKKYNVWVVPRGHGKTYLIMYKLVWECLNRPGKYLYVCPELKQARRNLWDDIKRFLGDVIKPVKLNGVTYQAATVNEAYSTVEFSNGSKLYILGADDPDNLRGLHPIGIVLDETQNIKPESWDVMEYARANLQWCIMIGTPMGHNFFWEQLNYAKDEPVRMKARIEKAQRALEQASTVEDIQAANQALENAKAVKPEWAWYHTDAYKLKMYTDDQLQEDRLKKLKQKGSDSFFRQEMLCDFDAAVSGAYYSYHMGQVIDEGRIADVPHDPSKPVHTFWDLGTSDATSIWFVQLTNTNRINVIDYLEMPMNGGLPDVIREVKAKSYIYGTHIAPFDADQIQANGLTKAQIAEKIGIRFEIAPKMDVEYGIEQVRMVLPRCWFDKSCSMGLEALKQYSPRINRDGQVAGPRHDKYSHGADAFRYLAVCIDDVVSYSSGVVYDWRKTVNDSSWYNPLEV